MLRIRKEVNLKELEKFGFKINKNKTAYEHKVDGNWWDIRSVDIEDRFLENYKEEIGYWTFTDNDDLLAIKFKDLIQARISRKSGGIKYVKNKR